MTTTIEAPPAVAVISPEEVYEERRRVFGAERDRFAALSRRLSNVRLLLFVGAVLCFILFVSGGSTLYLVAMGALLLVFAGLVVYHERVAQREQRYAELFAIQDEALKRLARRWNELPARPFATPEEDHPYANDVDVFGHASLFQLLDVTATSFGSSTLQRWLLEPATPAAIVARHRAVAELAARIDLRDEVALRGRLIGAKKPDPGPFLSWAEGEPWLLKRPAVTWAARLLPVATWAAIVASATGLSPYPIWLGMLAINLAVLAFVGVLVERTLASTYTLARAFRFYAELFEILCAASFESPELRRQQERLGAGGLDAHRQIGRLARIVNGAIPASSALYLPIQLLSFWNVHVLYLLERWQTESGVRVRSWLTTLGELEALSSLAGLAHAHPDWAFPRIEAAFHPAGESTHAAPATPPSAAASPTSSTYTPGSRPQPPPSHAGEGAGGSGQPRLVARGMGHPLIPPAARVDNDVEVGPPGTFLLVTGSNMSGKSTLLRALGTNIVLAQAGTVVCAAGLSLPPLALYTSIRVSDSLEKGISLFMAELLCLKQIVDAAASVEAGERTLFYLLDEILHGTNTAERQIAARRILAHLLAHGALGAVSTHDLQLADTSALAAARRDVHFVETFREDPEGPAMSFDYKLRPGLATSTNALKLMQIVGLKLDEPATKTRPSS